MNQRKGSGLLGLLLRLLLDEEAIVACKTVDDLLAPRAGALQQSRLRDGDAQIRP